MRVIGQLSLGLLAIVLPFVVIMLVLWNMVLPGVAEFICGAVDQVAFNLTIGVVVMLGAWFAGLATGVCVYKLMHDAMERVGGYY
jgi:hypothetical protein